MTYSVDVVCLDQPGMCTASPGSSRSRGIDIARALHAQLRRRAHRRADVLGVDGACTCRAIHIAALREEFMDLCDHLNLDAILEPLKS